MNHSLVRPLRQKWCNRVISAIEYQKEWHVLRSPEVEQARLAIIDMVLQERREEKSTERQRKYEDSQSTTSVMMREGNASETH